jgi:dihydropyrimidinase
MFGMYPKKGTITPGGDADIVVFDPNRKQVISVDNQHMRVDYSAYEGMEVTGKVETVLSRGRLIVDDGNYVGKPGDGEYIRRGLSQYLI